MREQPTPCVMGSLKAEPTGVHVLLATPPRWHDAEYSCPLTIKEIGLRQEKGQLEGLGTWQRWDSACLSPDFSWGLDRAAPQLLFQSHVHPASLLPMVAHVVLPQRGQCGFSLSRTQTHGSPDPRGEGFESQS